MRSYLLGKVWQALLPAKPRAKMIFHGASRGCGSEALMRAATGVPSGSERLPEPGPVIASPPLSRAGRHVLS
jgi:hypothetical protein